MPRVTKGVFYSADTPDFTNDELNRLRAALGGQLAPDILKQARELRSIYCNFLSMPLQMSTLAEADALRREWLSLLESVEQLVLSTTSGGSRKRADRALRQLLAPNFGAAAHALVEAAWKLRTIVQENLDDDANIADIRQGRAAGLRAVLWILYEPVGGGLRRGESYGLAMSSGAGRGSPKLREFLSAITAREISGDDVKNALRFMTKRNLMPKLGCRLSGFGTSVTEFPNIW